MLVDTKPELITFSQTWQNKSKDQVVEEISSYCLETKRTPDNYSFKVIDGKLISPETGQRVEDVVVKDTPIGKLEAQALEQIQEWSDINSKGVLFWLSPPELGFYPTSKIIISELGGENGDKVLFNRAIILDLDENNCLEFAQRLASFSSNQPDLSSSDSIRRSPLFLKEDTIHWTYILEELIEDLSLNDVRLGKDQRAKQKFLSQAEAVYQEVFAERSWIDPQELAYQLNIRGMLGNFDPSCPLLFEAMPIPILSPFEYFFQRSVLLENKDKYYCKKCPVCNQEINCVVKPGESCPMKNCKAVRKCS